jgi:hypothetical protein
MLDAGISGGAAAADAGSVTLMVGGDVLVLDQIRDVLALFSGPVFYCGASGAGHTAKAKHEQALGGGCVPCAPRHCPLLGSGHRAGVAIWSGRRTLVVGGLTPDACQSGHHGQRRPVALWIHHQVSERGRPIERAKYAAPIESATRT